MGCLALYLRRRQRTIREYVAQHGLGLGKRAVLLSEPGTHGERFVRADLDGTLLPHDHRGLHAARYHLARNPEGEARLVAAEVVLERDQQAAVAARLGSDEIGGACRRHESKRSAYP